MTENQSVIAARAYVARGLAVFPLSGKMPLTEHGVKDATADLELVELWFRDERNIAIAIPEGVVVVDVDPRNGGDVSFEDWKMAYGGEPYEHAPHALTGGGGEHFWFRMPPGVTKLKKNPAKGIDLLTVGRYVVAPPSMTDAKYRWWRALPGVMGALEELPGYITTLATPEVVAPRTTPLSLGGDAFDEAAHRYTTWTQLLIRHGWLPVGGMHDVNGSKWRHPTSDNQFSATIKHDCLFVYSPNTPFPVTEPGDPHGVTLFSAIETLDFHGDRNALIRELVRLNYLADRSVPHASVADVPIAAPPRATAEAEDDDEETASRVELSSAEDIVPRRARWLWDGRIPVGGLTLLAGREGEGKSTLAIHLMAQVTQGTLEGEYYGTPRDVIIIATEDSMECTIVPRLLAAGGDMKRVFLVEMKDPTDTLSLPVHLPDLERACAAHDAALIVMDPLLSRLSGSLDSHKDADVRRALEPLGKFAQRINAAILGLIHLNKAGQTDPLNAVMASKAFTAFARSVLFAMVDPEQEERRLLGLVKANLGRVDLPTLTYTFEPVTVGEDDGPIVATRIQWGENSESSIRQALEIPAANMSDVAQAEQWLGHWLAVEGGSALYSEVENAARKNLGKDVQMPTVRRAFKKLGGEFRRTAYQGTTVWALPGAPVMTDKPRVPDL